MYDQLFLLKKIPMHLFRYLLIKKFFTILAIASMVIQILHNIFEYQLKFLFSPDSDHFLRYHISISNTDSLLSFCLQVIHD